MANKLDLNDAIDFFRDVGFTVIIMDDDKPDIVERLRDPHLALDPRLLEAADEIERLEAKCVQVDRYIALLNGEIADNGKLRDEIERLRADNRRLRGVVRSAPCPGGGYTGQPADEYPSVKACLTAGVCGCTLGAALDLPT